MIPVEILQIKCEECGYMIKLHDSCECGMTLADIAEIEFNNRELSEAFKEV